jgi:UDP-N-acetylmuramoyl-tripeptide--D-alanyl-D-alanine ligase
MDTDSIEVQYQICCQAPRIISQLDQVEPGDVYYAVKLYRPRRRVQRWVWESLRWMEFYAPWLAPLLLWFARPTPWYLDLKRQVSRQLDGNAYARRALSQGASYAFVDDPRVAKDERYILVDDAMARIVELATRRRQELELPVLAISGSSGKTTTHALVTAVLARKFERPFARRMDNTVVSIAKWIFDIDKHDLMILEFGGLAPKTLSNLCQLSQPTHGLLTNIGVAHLVTYGSVDGIRRGKWELVDYLLANGGHFFANNNDTWIREQVLPADQTTTFGSQALEPNPEVIGEFLSADPLLRLSWTPPGAEPLEIQTRLVGAYNFENVMAAIAVGQHFGVELAQIVAAIEACEPADNRSQWIQQGGNQFVLDSGSVNPSSLAASMTNFEQIRSSSKMVVLADMMRLGSQTHAAHREAIAHAKQMNLIQAVFVGPHYWRARDPDFGQYFRSTTIFERWWRQQTFSDRLVLVKGAMRFGLVELMGFGQSRAED